MSSRKPRRYDRSVHYIADWVMLSELIADPAFENRPRDEQEELRAIWTRLDGMLSAKNWSWHEALLIRLARREGQLSQAEWEEVKQPKRPTHKRGEMIRKLCRRIVRVEFPREDEQLQQLGWWLKAKLEDPSIPPFDFTPGLRPWEFSRRMRMGRKRQGAAQTPEDDRKAEFMRHYKNLPTEAQNAMLLLSLKFLLSGELPDADEVDATIAWAKRTTEAKAQPEPEPTDPEWQDADDQDRIDDIAGELLDQIDWRDDEEA